jgi:DNA-binding MarR family transcriptional regulator
MFHDILLGWHHNSLAQMLIKGARFQRGFAEMQKGWAMDWDDLRIFLAVARHESLSAAGRALKIDPATVGRRIARLEDAIG